VSTRVARSPVSDALGGAVDAIAAAGSETPRLDAELLLAEATGWERAKLIASPDEALPSGAGREFAAMVRRRVRREPVAYILGRKGFRGIELAVDRRVLVPRPETELLVEVALELEPSIVFDVGTGSGAVALAIAEEIPDAKVTATDASSAALELARANAERLGLGRHVSFEQGTLPGGPADLLVANLPYVSAAEWEALAPEIREHEPREALVPEPLGETGLEAIEALLDELAGRNDVAAVALEIGATQAGAVEPLVRRAGYGAVEVRRDLAGLDRVVVGRRDESR
jgi:release factor glutamine methyltransferase